LRKRDREKRAGKPRRREIEATVQKERDRGRIQNRKEIEKETNRERQRKRD
jgi:hypothetical protein